MPAPSRPPARHRRRTSTTHTLAGALSATLVLSGAMEAGAPAALACFLAAATALAAGSNLVARFLPGRR